MKTLYVVATPIGNLEDVTLRAVRILNEVNLIAAEDTRVTRKLLSHYDIHTRLISYNEQNRKARLPFLLERLTEMNVALVSDAGTPGIRDPGRELVEKAVKSGISVVPVPGPSALTAAISVSGLPADQFLFLGYLPRNKKERQELLESMADETRTLVAFEVPHRLKASLADLAVTFGTDRFLMVGREMTKVYEEIYRGEISEAINHFSEPRGEYTFVITGASLSSEPSSLLLESVATDLQKLKAEGALAREAVKAISEKYRLPRRRVYAMWLQV
ncbi:MAG: 16S rRNA (cytidine(1402)-2'-O)-methyltransferase [SAR202 cluster bacterium Io17-Chloro-G3]|nr:MAG: 16S rRNA (cytidine(1402)-2'-O)-methyltransferase [SAR202 cluster bacterium Io17-Chloro-G3]